MTQHEADLRRWIVKRNAATNFTLWLIAQKQVDNIFLAMGCGPAPLAALVDDEFVFPQVRAQFEELREAAVERAANGVHVNGA